MQDDSQNIYKVIDNLTLPDYEIPAGKTDEYFKQFGVFEDVLGSYSPGKHLTQVKKRGSIVLKWHEVLLAAIRLDPELKPTVCARALYIVQVAVYDAWAAYSPAAKGVYWDTSKIVRQTRNAVNAEKAMAFAAYTAASALFPLAEKAFGIFMAQAGIDKDAAGTVAKVRGNPGTPEGVGVAAGDGVIKERLNDGSNQTGGYKETPPYVPDNEPLKVDQKGPYPIKNPNAWQPLQRDGMDPQKAATPQWGGVTPFSETQLADPPPFPQNTDPTGASLYRIQADEVLGYSASLGSDKNRVISDYWADFKNSSLPPGHWTVFAVWLSYTRNYSVGQDVVLLFALTAAMFDASIICWKTKYVNNSPRPITAVNVIYGKELVTAFKFGKPPAGETQVTRVKGCDWRPYQPKFSPTPPFPAYTSGHSTFGAAASTVMQLFTRSNYFGLGVTIPKESLVSDMSYNSVLAPEKNVTLYWETFSEASEENGISRLYGGVHYQRDNIWGMSTGTAVGNNAWEKVLKLVTSDLQQPELPEKPKQAPAPVPKKISDSTTQESPAHQSSAAF